jgi:hypothetical protein
VIRKVRILFVIERVLQDECVRVNAVWWFVEWWKSIVVVDHSVSCMIINHVNYRRATMRVLVKVLVVVHPILMWWEVMLVGICSSVTRIVCHRQHSQHKVDNIGIVE